ncbi:hypothetical protein [Cellulomonas endometrii]|uniref:hypothetical protein n=1 Tax=Cellulomonas endometrii TaxID=3036301 RepID=UPI0024ACDDE4|nr:hypothetical protein [Cellulomonas endometrii]
MTTWTHHRGSPAPVGAARDGDLAGVVRVLGVAAVALTVVVAGQLLHLGAWPVTGAVAVALLALARPLSLPLAAVAVAGCWCLVTGFSVNDGAVLTLAVPDLGRLAVLAGAAVVARVGNESVRPRHFAANRA